MSLEHKSIDAIAEVDLQELVKNSVREGTRIDYKQALPGNADQDKKAFLADISAFANARGGDLVYGIREEDGVAVEISGLASLEFDTERLRLESIIRDGIAPRIPGIASRAVPLSSGASAIVVRIPRSWAGPHMIVFKNWTRFYSRTSAGNYQLDVSQLRDAFLASDGVIERVRRFRFDRLAKITAGETPVPLAEGAKVVIQVVPMSAFTAGALVDLNRAKSASGLQPLGESGYNSRFNFDGIVTFGGNGSDHWSYAQLFRNGCIETVDRWLLSGEGRIVPGRRLESGALECVFAYRSLLRSLGSQSPLVVMLTLLGVAGYRTGEESNRSYPAERPDLLVPEVLIDDDSSDLARAMRPAFDAVWNAFGRAGSPNYDEDGSWRLQ